MSSKKSSGFGTPKPLPGQASYGITEAQMLEKQAEEMEMRLKMLQARMQEAEASEPQVGSGGTRWKSARPDKGGVTTYARDVKDRQQRKAAERSIVATAEGTTAAAITTSTSTTSKQRESSSKQSSSMSAPAPKEQRVSKSLAEWTVADVCVWLESKGLGQYVETFQSNQIAGAVLCDLSLEDMDYMGITALGHRKLLLKGIDELSQLKTSRKPSKASTVASSEAVEPSRSTSTVHWSQLEPIANNKVSAPSAVLNAADDDALDEEAERRAFTEAVMQWRRMGKEESGASSNQTNSAGASADGGMWANPFDNPSTTREPDEWKSASASSGGAGGSVGGSLLDGTYDEEKERREFAAAVAAWRAAGKSSTETNSSSSGKLQPVESTGTGTGTATSTLVSTASVADRISKAMEEEHRRMVQRIQEEQEAARRRLEEASRDLEELKRKKDDDLVAVGNKDGMDIISPNVVAAQESSQSVITAHPDDIDFADDALSAASETGYDGIEDDAHEESKVLVELVESRMDPTAGLGDAVDCAYFVEEASDDEA